MKKLLFTFLVLFINTAFAQKDKHGNPIFNSISLSEENTNGYLFSCNYYTLRDNIENANSSVFVSKTPSLSSIEKAATSLPSNFFIIVKNGKITAMLSLKKDKQLKITILDPYTRSLKEVDSGLDGDITETRANELLANRYDTTAKIDNGRLIFNQRSYKIISYTALKQAVLNLVGSQKLDKDVPNGMPFVAQTEIREKILSASKPGGELDVWTPIKGHEYDGVIIEKGVFATKFHIACSQWAYNVVGAGITGENAVYALYAEAVGHPITEREKSYLLYGYKKALQDL
jgi:hypothetical protein